MTKYRMDRPGLRRTVPPAATSVIESEAKMAKRGPRQLVKMRSTESHHLYLTTKNRRNNDKRLELKKYDPVLRKHVVYRETR